MSGVTELCAFYHNIFYKQVEGIIKNLKHAKSRETREQLKGCETREVSYKSACRNP